MPRRLAGTILAMAILVGCSFGCDLVPRASTQQGQAVEPLDATMTAQASAALRVIKVVDGDTLDIEMNGRTERVRVIGIDTPETVDPRSPVQCFGREASARAIELLAGKRVRLTADPTQADRDRFDRILRYVELPDGRDFGLWMVLNGYAHEFTYGVPYQRQLDYRAAYAEARANNRGFWAPDTCDGDTRRTAGTPTRLAPVASPTPR